MPEADKDPAAGRMELFRDTLSAAEKKRLNRDIWRLAAPTFIGQGLHAAVTFVTRAMAGRLGDQAFNGVNLGLQIFMVIITVIAAVAVGTTALVAQSWGAGDRKDAGRVLQQSLIWGVILCVLISALGIPAGRLLFAAMKVDTQTAELGNQFMFWLLLAIPLMGIGFFLSAGLRAAGDARTPMWATAIMGVVAIVSSYGFILGGFGLPKLGTIGAAIAINASFVSMTGFLGALFLMNRTVIKLPLRGWRLDRRIGLAIFRIGLPSAAEWVLIQAGLLIYIFVINFYGPAASAGYFAGMAVLMFAQTPAFGFQTAASTLVGQSIGARDYARAESVFRRCNLLSCLLMATVGLAMIALAHPSVLGRLFGELSPEALGHASTYTVLTAFAMPVMGLAFTTAGGLRGAGDTWTPLTASITGIFGLRIALALVVYHLFHPPIIYIWCSMFPDMVLRVAVMGRRLMTGKWKAVKVMREARASAPVRP